MVPGRDALKELGLPEDETRVYEALSSGGPMTAGDISNRSRLPVGRIYEITDSLRRRGLVKVSVGRPVTYTAVPPAAPAMAPTGERTETGRRPENSRCETQEGFSYVIKESKPILTFEILDALQARGLRVLLITRTSSRARTPPAPSFQVCWLGKTPPSGEMRIVDRLDEIIRLARDFTRPTGTNTLVVLDGVEYLVNQYDFSSVLRCIHDLVEIIASQKSRLLLPIDPQAIGEKEMALISRDMQVLTPEILYR